MSRPVYNFVKFCYNFFIQMHQGHSRWPAHMVPDEDIGDPEARDGWQKGYPAGQERVRIGRLQWSGVVGGRLVWFGLVWQSLALWNH